MSDRFYNTTMASACLFFAALSACGMMATRLYVDPYPFFLRVVLLLVMLLVALFYRRRREEKLLNLVTITFWTVVFGNVHLFPMFIAARFRVELSDGLLARIDRAMGIETPTVLAWMGRHPALRASLAGCYGTLILMMTLAIVVLPLSGRMRSAKQYTIACVASALISMPLFAVFQAVGPWVHYGYVPQIDQSSYLQMFNRLRSYDAISLDLSYREGLICFPSFHTILAVLTAIALWPVPGLRWIAAAWGALIVVSTVTTGTHYVIDVAAGLAVAVLAQGAARGFSAWEASRHRALEIGQGGLGRRTPATAGARSGLATSQ